LVRFIDLPKASVTVIVCPDAIVNFTG